MKSEATTEVKNFSWLDVPKSIWYFLAEDKKRFSVAFVVLSMIFLYDLIPPLVVGKIVDFFTDYNPGQSLSTFYHYVVFITITWILASLIRLKSKNIFGHIRSNARARARVWGFERLTDFSLEWHNKENTGNKLQKIFTGSDAVAGLVRMAQRDLIKIFVNTLGVLLFFLFADLKFIILVVIYIIVFFSISILFAKRIYRISNEFNILNQAAGGTYVESASNMLSIKALGGEKGIISRVHDREILTRDTGIQKINISNLKWRIFQCVNGVTLGIFLYMLGISVVSGSLTVGMVLIFYNYFDRLGRYFSDLDDLFLDLIDLKSDLANMMPIFRETEFIKTGNDSFPKDWDKIEIKNGSMSYASDQVGLNGFNLALRRNTKTGVAGLSGSGKSTLAKIVLGLYALKSGEFKIGHKNYYSINHNETLSNITVVLQETELFNLSLRDNITMMRGGDSELLDLAVEISQLTGVVDRLPEGLDAKIGEKGYMLSGGERQRLGIARAIYKNAPIIILDEATSSLDSETEGKIMEKLLGQYGEDKTFLIIAHRLGTLRYTDNIAVMERGSVVEEGSYGKLMNDIGSVFYKMNKEIKK
jgi:ABC-type multidrug transport system fused ATPase/permease subunit